MTTHKPQFPNPKEALFSVGLIADPQHADIEDRWNFLRTTLRRYRRGLDITKNAVRIWNDELETNPKPIMVICLGDIIDGLNRHSKESIKAMENMLKAFGEFKPNTKIKINLENKNNEINNNNNNNDNDNDNEKKNIDNDNNTEKKNKKKRDWELPQYPYFHNVIGNHELYNFNRIELMEYMYNPTSSDPMQYYYTVRPYPGFVFIFLDSYVVSTHGYKYIDQNPTGLSNQQIEEARQICESAKKLLQQHNSNTDQNSAAGLKDDLKRYVAYNGGFGEKQLKWFREELEKCKKNEEKVFVFAHLPTSCVKGDEKILAWDYDQFRQSVDQFRPCVKMVFAGHDHCGELTYVNGVWYRTLEGAIESDSNKDCFATAYFYEDQVFLKGYGMIEDELYQFKPVLTENENTVMHGRVVMDAIKKEYIPPQMNHKSKNENHLLWMGLGIIATGLGIGIKWYGELSDA